MANFPKAFDDPVYDAADVSSAATAGVDPILLRSVRVNGERSNADQVSSAQATTPYQFIPATRKAILDKYGIDVTLNPQNASLGAAYLLKEGLDRNKGDQSAAVAEYHGGTDLANHGPVTKAYADRVIGGAKNAFLDSLVQKDAQTSVNAQPPQAEQSSSAPSDVSASSPDKDAFLDSLAQKFKAEPSIGAKAADIVTGDLRRTPETESAPDWTQLPEYANDFGAKGFKAALGTTFTGPAETAKVIKAQFPDVQVRQDDKGNFFLKSAEDGKEYAIKPGFRPSDIPRALGAVAAFTPAGRAESLLGAGAANAGTQAVIEGTQAATGGDFNPGDVVAAGVLGAAVPAASRVGSAVLGKIRGAAPATDEALNATKAAETAPPAQQSATVAPESAPVAQPAGPAQSVQQPDGVWTWKSGDHDYPVDIIPQTHTAPDGREYQRVLYQGKETFVPKDQLTPPTPTTATLKDIPAAEPVPPAAQAAEAPAPPITPNAEPSVAPISGDELSATTKAATGTGKSATRAQQVLAEQAAPDAETIAAAKRLGIEDNLQPDHVSTNQSFRELSQAIKSVPGSAARSQELEGLQAVGKRADSLMEELGGTKDLSTLSENVKNQMHATGDELSDKADQLYKQIRENIPADTRVTAPTTLDFIKQRASDLGGQENLSPLEKSIVKKLTPKESIVTEVTPGQVGLTPDVSSVVPKVVNPTYNLLDDVRGTVGAAARMAGPFKDGDTGLAKKLYELITADQEAAVQPFGMTSVIDSAKAAVRTRKGLENDMVSLFGKNLGSSLVGNLSGGAKALEQGDVSRFVRLIQAVPENLRQDVAASALNFGFGRETKAGSLNFNTFSRWYEGLQRNKQAYAALMANLPKEARQSLHDLYLVSSNISKASRERVETGRINLIKGQLEGADTAIEKIYEAVKGLGKGLGYEAASSAVGLHGAGLAAGIASALSKAKPDALKAADKLISSPEFISMARSSASGKPISQGAVKQLSKSARMRQFFKEVGSPANMKDHEKWLSSLFQSANESQN